MTVSAIAVPCADVREPAAQDRHYIHDRPSDAEAYRTMTPIAGEAMNVPTVLVVDNDQENLDLVEQALAGEDYKIHRVRSGPDAIGLMMSTRIDMVILDLDMPEMNGIAVLEVIRYIPRLMRSQVIVQSSPGDAHNVSRARELGACGVLEKPLSPQAVRAEVQTVLSGATEALIFAGAL